ncbi:hypothetical protein [Thermoflavimicrobium dichotomicum]|uniref:Uncharacterized protein n=1 Tax=Thermoflavimicrobium dichotomicum TaxID=46223 RepID=A0A1I3UWZ3_9BACL|nr:hypothetical protein [Thermoflavimicrobium dichotomicum]SFJ87595.1 hypothetical protein SAMN05421852_12920 [Thermoflavimicrobium dichotomicum]
MKFKLVISAVIVVGLTLCSGFYYNSAFSQSNKEFRTFVGGLPSKETAAKKATHQKERKEMLKRMSEKLPNGNVEATVTFQHFLSLSEVQKLIDKYPSIEIKRVWYWVPGQDGRAMTIVKGRDIKKSVDDAIKRLEKSNHDVNVKETLDKMSKGNLGVFSISVKGKYSHLNEMSNEEVIKLIDVHYNEGLEKQAKEAGKKARYVELPEKPDGSR